jgi:hypothetical protein
MLTTADTSFSRVADNLKFTCSLRECCLRGCSSGLRRQYLAQFDEQNSVSTMRPVASDWKRYVALVIIRQEDRCTIVRVRCDTEDIGHRSNQEASPKGTIYYIYLRHIDY